MDPLGIAPKSFESIPISSLYLENNHQLLKAHKGYVYKK